ncbi:MAG: HTH domain-containing protein [Candidatus Heimdallarchaeota archaeon]|nr:HTH domain-containing protein [Candidatus Heimdallarchaeota archaeon]
MSPSEKLLLLINLLNSKSHVSLYEIIKKCNISERSAYRYLNSLSEYNIPIYFDKEMQGYCLTRRTTIHNDSLPDKDYLLIKICLKIVSRSVSLCYRATLDNIISKLSIGNTLNVENSLDLIQQEFEPADLRTSDFSEIISSALIVSAISSKRRIRLLRVVSENNSDTDTIINPALSFEGNWKVCDDNTNPKLSILLKDIKKVEILK